MPLTSSAFVAALPLRGARERAKKKKAEAAAAAAAAAAEAEAKAKEEAEARGSAFSVSSTSSSSSTETTWKDRFSPSKAAGRERGAAATVAVSASSSSAAVASPPPPPLSLQGSTLASFDLGAVLGTGSFGKVQLARHRPTGTVCAVKSLSKRHLLRTGQVAHLVSEKGVLSSLSGEPAFVRLLATFQDERHVYLALEFVRGGEFFRHLRARGRLSENAARAYAAEVAVALEAMHDGGIVYRDLKPENLLLDSTGHIKVTDMGFAKVLPRGKRTFTLCGTPDYIAPEVLLNKGHGKGADWWSFGVLVYEVLAGFPPFCAPEPAETYRRIVQGEWSCPSHFSPSAKDLVRRLLTPDLSLRLGCLAGGASDIRKHAWFKGVDWACLSAARTPTAAATRAAKRGLPPPPPPAVSAASLPQPPIVPSSGSGSEDDTSNFDDYSAMEAASAEAASPAGGDGESGGLTRAEQAEFADF